MKPPSSMLFGRPAGLAGHLRFQLERRQPPARPGRAVEVPPGTHAPPRRQAPGDSRPQPMPASQPRAKAKVSRKKEMESLLAPEAEGKGFGKIDSAT